MELGDLPTLLKEKRAVCRPESSCANWISLLTTCVDSRRLMRGKQRGSICITSRRITVLVVSDDSMRAIAAILGVAEKILRAHRDVLPAAAHWLGQPVPKGTSRRPKSWHTVLICE